MTISYLAIFLLIVLMFGIEHLKYWVNKWVFKSDKVDAVSIKSMEEQKDYGIRQIHREIRRQDYL